MSNPIQQKRIAIVGTGPAGLMAASQLLLSVPDASAIQIHVFDRRPGAGRKLLVAGSSGLNISHDLPLPAFAAHYAGFSAPFWRQLLTDFSPEHWLAFIQNQLGLETFLGTSNRYFVREMKAANLVKKWVDFLESRCVQFHLGHEMTDADLRTRNVTFTDRAGESYSKTFDAIGLFLGGGSWEDTPPLWPDVLSKNGVKIAAFEPKNVGFEVTWSPAFLKEAEGMPIKKVKVTTSRGEKIGELMITRYGLEGTPVYFTGVVGPAVLDLKPDLTEEEILNRLTSVKENYSPLRRIQKTLQLGDAPMALLFHHAPKTELQSVKQAARLVKNFPLQLLAPRTLSEAISSSGGVQCDQVDDHLQFHAFRDAYCAGEMLDWDTVTGGFLIQASVSQGARVGRMIGKSLAPRLTCKKSLSTG